jgi:hypothetical protein
MTGDGEFFAMDLFGDGQRKMMQFGVTTLAVRRYGIVDLRLETVVSQILLQFVTTSTEDGKDVPDTVARSAQRTRTRFVALEP